MPVGVWEYDREDDALRTAAIIAMDRLAPPDFEVHVVSGRGDHRQCRLPQARSPTRAPSCMSRAGHVRGRARGTVAGPARDARPTRVALDDADHRDRSWWNQWRTARGGMPSAAGVRCMWQPLRTRRRSGLVSEGTRRHEVPRSRACREGEDAVSGERRSDNPADEDRVSRRSWNPGGAFGDAPSSLQTILGAAMDGPSRVRSRQIGGPDRPPNARRIPAPVA
jgi:hypothetical protein